MDTFGRGVWDTHYMAACVLAKGMGGWDSHITSIALLSRRVFGTIIPFLWERMTGFYC
jgi:hypothetical protein